MPTLNWIGKQAVVNHDKEVPFKLLKKVKSISVGEKSENLIIHGDNLEALKALMPYYQGEIKCIYIDPPYNTGNEGWVYNDKVNSPKIKQWLGKVVGKESEDLTRHDKWLCMMYPRLILLRDLLKEDGVLFASIDDNEQSNFKLVCDEIFGSNNFIRNIACINNPKGRSDDKYIATAHESILVYRKSPELQLGGFEPSEKITRRYRKKDQHGLYREIDLRKTGDGDLRKDRPNMYYPFWYNKNTEGFEVGKLSRKAPKGFMEILPMKSRKTEGRWRWGADNAKTKIDNLYPKYMPSKKQWSVFEKDYLDNRDSVTPTSVWDFKDVNSERGTETFIKFLGFNKSDFPNPKPVGTLKRILSIATEKDSLVLDSFAGSGTTGHATLELNKDDGGKRKFILVEMEDGVAKEVTAERVRRAIKKYKYKDGFEYCELGKPLFDENGQIEGTCDFKQLATYIYFTETQTNIDNKKIKDNFIGENYGTEYYLIYKGRDKNDLNKTFLKRLKKGENKKVVYADRCLVDDDVLKKFNVEFKQIPYEVRVY